MPLSTKNIRQSRKGKHSREQDVNKIEARQHYHWPCEHTQRHAQSEQNKPEKKNEHNIYWAGKNKSNTNKRKIHNSLKFYIRAFVHKNQY